MMDIAPPTPVSTPDERASLASRKIPQMILSTATNPLTAPLLPLSSTSATARAADRFTVSGNIIITGGAGTLALASAQALLEHGASAICLMDLASTLASSASAINTLQATFPTTPIHTLPVDVTSSTAVDTAFAQATQLMSSIDILICFAGIVGCVPSISATPDQFKKVVDVNLNGSFLCAQAAARYMVASATGGSILFTASISAHATNYPQPQSAYNVSKAGVSHLTKNLAAEWAVHGIRVNCIAPGYMDTVLNEGDGLKEVREVWASRCPMGRMGAIEEITGPVVLLCSQRAGRYMTGAELVVDGGALCF